MAVRPEGGLRFSDGREVFGFSTDKPERAAGISGAKLLFIVDEASGVDERIFEALEGNRAGGSAPMILFSNPTQTSGYFFETHHRNREQWHCIHVSSEQAAKHKGIPGLATHEWIEEKKREWGEDSPIYAVRVKGDFPTEHSCAVISLGQVDAARLRWDGVISPYADASIHNAPLTIGVDVARFGDDETVIQAVRGGYAFPPVAVRSLDSLQVAARVMHEINEHRHSNENVCVNVDAIGVGSGVVDQLNARAPVWLAVNAINVAERSLNEDQYVNLRAQITFGVRDWLKDGGKLPPDGQLESELLAPIYSFDSRGRYQIEPKELIKRRIGRSPDRADALALACFRAQYDAAAAVLLDDTPMPLSRFASSGSRTEKSEQDRQFEDDEDTGWQ